jgi:hypothetical protein
MTSKITSQNYSVAVLFLAGTTRCMQKEEGLEDEKHTVSTNFSCFILKKLMWGERVK